jgi:hypothetical protein
MDNVRALKVPKDLARSLLRSRLFGNDSSLDERIVSAEICLGERWFTGLTKFVVQPNDDDDDDDDDDDNNNVDVVRINRIIRQWCDSSDVTCDFVTMRVVVHFFRPDLVCPPRVGRSHVEGTMKLHREGAHMTNMSKFQQAFSDFLCAWIQNVHTKLDCTSAETSQPHFFASD